MFRLIYISFAYTLRKEQLIPKSFRFLLRLHLKTACIDQGDTLPAWEIFLEATTREMVREFGVALRGVEQSKTPDYFGRECGVQSKTYFGVGIGLKTFLIAKWLGNGPLQEHSAVTEVSVIFYFTSGFRIAFTDPIYHIRRQICYANHVLSECEIPVKLYIYCIEELEGFFENTDGMKRLDNFENAKENLLNTADIGILMCGTSATDFKGYARMGPTIKTGQPPIAWVHPELDLIFLHEVSHIFGCEHDRDWFEKLNHMTDLTR